MMETYLNSQPSYLEEILADILVQIHVTLTVKG